MPRTQKFYVSLAETDYNGTNKVYTVGDLANYNLENVSQVTVDQAGKAKFCVSLQLRNCHQEEKFASY